MTYQFNFFWLYSIVGLLDHMVDLFYFLRNCHIIFHNGCTNLHPYQQYMSSPFSRSSPPFVIFLDNVSLCYSRHISTLAATVDVCHHTWPFFQIGSLFVAQASLKFMILLPQPPGSLNYRIRPSCSVSRLDQELSQVSMWPQPAEHSILVAHTMEAGLAFIIFFRLFDNIHSNCNEVIAWCSFVFPWQLVMLSIFSYTYHPIGSFLWRNVCLGVLPILKPGFFRRALVSAHNVQLDWRNKLGYSNSRVTVNNSNAIYILNS